MEYILSYGAHGCLLLLRRRLDCSHQREEVMGHSRAWYSRSRGEGANWFLLAGYFNLELGMQDPTADKDGTLILTIMEENYVDGCDESVWLLCPHE